MFKKGEKVPGGEHLTAEQRAKIIADRKAGKKWKDIAAELNVPTKRAMTWAKRKWYKEGMSAGDVPTPEVKKDLPVTKDPPVTDEGKKKDKDKEAPTGDVDKTKDAAGKIVTKKIEEHIKKSDKAPAGVSKTKGEGKEAGDVDKVSKKGLSVPKTAGMWFLLAIVLAVVVIFVVFLLLKPSKLEKADYGKPTEKKSQPGFENRNIDDLPG